MGNEEQTVAECLKNGDIDGAARAVMAARNISLDDARKVIFERLKNQKR